MKGKLILGATLGAILAAIVCCGCRTTKQPPLFGPHDVRTMTNKELDALLRNVYSDGFTDAMKINEL